MSNDDYGTKEEVWELIKNEGMMRFSDDPFSYSSPQDAIDEVWREDPGVKEIYDAAPSVPEPAAIVKSDSPTRPTTVRDYLHEAITKRAEADQLKPGNLSKSHEELYFQLVNYDAEATRLYNLMSSAHGATEIGEARGEIRKAYGTVSELGEVLNIAGEWLR